MSIPLYIATDRRNAFSWISRGLILPAAFMDKYKDDAMHAGAGALLVSDAETAARLAGASAMPVVVELDTDGLDLRIEATAGVAFPVRGALSARRIVRLHLPDEAEREEVAARTYRGFDGATLPLAVTPELFAGVQDIKPPVAHSAQAVLTDDVEVRRREALVAGAATILSEQLAHRVVDVLLTTTGDCWTDLVTDLRRGGTVTSEADAGLLTQVGEVLIAQPRGAEPSADDVIEAVRERLPENLLNQVARHLEWIVQLSRGETALQPFKDRGGVRSVKALLLYLLRPTPEGVRGWDAEEQNAGSEVVDLAALFAGLASGYGGLPAGLRTAPKLGALLDWAAAGLQPSDIRPSKRPAAAVQRVEAAKGGDEGTAQESSPETVKDGSIESGGEAHSTVDDLRRRLETSVADGQEAEALSVAERLGWDDAQLFVVMAPRFEVTARGRQVEVSFPFGATPHKKLVAHRFIERLEGIADDELKKLLRADQAVAPPPKTTRKRSRRPAGLRPTASASRPRNDAVAPVTEVADEGDAPESDLA